jgi:phosphatidate cytidylyltransferase
MLRTRILTAAVLACLLLSGLFLLPPSWAVAAFGVVFTVAAWEWAGFGAVRGGAARGAYAAGMALVLYLAWSWTGDRAHLMLLLRAALVWWVIALLWLSLAPSRHRSALVLACGWCCW